MYIFLQETIIHIIPVNSCYCARGGGRREGVSHAPADVLTYVRLFFQFLFLKKAACHPGGFLRASLHLVVSVVRQPGGLGIAEKAAKLGLCSCKEYFRLLCWVAQ